MPRSDQIHSELNRVKAPRQRPGALPVAGYGRAAAQTTAGRAKHPLGGHSAQHETSATSKILRAARRCEQRTRTAAPERLSSALAAPAHGAQPTPAANTARKPGFSSTQRRRRRDADQTRYSPTQTSRRAACLRETSQRCCRPQRPTEIPHHGPRDIEDPPAQPTVAESRIPSSPAETARTERVLVRPPSAVSGSAVFPDRSGFFASDARATEFGWCKHPPRMAAPAGAQQNDPRARRTGPPSAPWNERRHRAG